MGDINLIFYVVLGMQIIIIIIKFSSAICLMKFAQELGMVKFNPPRLDSAIYLY